MRVRLLETSERLLVVTAEVLRAVSPISPIKWGVGVSRDYLRRHQRWVASIG